MHPIAHICIYIFQNFPGVTPPDPQNWAGVKPTPQTPLPVRASTVPLFQSFCGRTSYSPACVLLGRQASCMKTRLDDRFCLATHSLPDRLTHTHTYRQREYRATSPHASTYKSTSDELHIFYNTQWINTLHGFQWCWIDEFFTLHICNPEHFCCIFSFFSILLFM